MASGRARSADPVAYKGHIVYRNHERPFSWSATIARFARFSMLWRHRKFRGVLRGARHLSRSGGLQASKCRPSLCGTKYL